MRSKINLLLIFLLIISLTFSFVNDNAFAESKTFQVRAGETRTLTFSLGSGDRIEFWISVSGGSGNDVNLTIRDPYDVIILQGLASKEYNSQFTADNSGSYEFEFDNSFSIISSKTVNFSYEIWEKPAENSYGTSGSVFGMEWLIILIVIAVIIGSSVAIGLSMRKRRLESRQKGSIAQDPKTTVKMDQNQKALDILKSRLARGEITKEEYDNLKKEFE